MNCYLKITSLHESGITTTCQDFQLIFIFGWTVPLNVYIFSCLSNTTWRGSTQISLISSLSYLCGTVCDNSCCCVCLFLILCVNWSKLWKASPGHFLFLHNGISALTAGLSQLLSAWFLYPSAPGYLCMCVCTNIGQRGSVWGWALSPLCLQ